MTLGDIKLYANSLHISWLKASARERRSIFLDNVGGLPDPEADYFVEIKFDFLPILNRFKELNTYSQFSLCY